MTNIHMETENVRTLARLLDQTAGNFDETVNTLKRARIQLSNSWSGETREKQFMNKFNSLLIKMNAKTNELQTLSVRVYHEVDKWEKVDSKKWEDKDFWGKYWSEIKDVSPDDVVRLISTISIISGLKEGTYYAGEVIFKGSRSLKESVGLFPTLNHIRVDHIPGSLLKKALREVTPLEIGLAGLEFGNRALKDWGNYEDGTEKATALALDAAFVASKTVVIHYTGYALVYVVTNGLLLVNAPVIPVAAVGIALWWGVSYFGGQALETGFETFKGDLVRDGGKILDQAGVSISNGADSVASTTKPILNTIDDLFSDF